VDDTITFCLRGLETEFPKGKQRRRRNKTIARDMVLEEQRYYNSISKQQQQQTQTQLGENKDEENNNKDIVQVEAEAEDPVMAIADVYRVESIPALQRALDIAKNDEFIANCIYSDDNDDNKDDNNNNIKSISNSTISTASLSLSSTSILSLYP